MIKGFLDIVEKILMVVMGILMLLMVIVIFYQVVLRYAFSNATSWADELARYALVWIVMLATPVGFRRYRHITIDVLVRYFPPKVRRITDLCMNILLIAFMAVLFVYTLEIIRAVRGQISQSSGIPMTFVYASVAVSAVLTIIVLLENIYNEFIARRRSGKEETV